MGWLGYFVGKNEHLEKLVIKPFTPSSGASVRDVIQPFLRGVSCNKSIQKITFFGVDLLGGEMFTMMCPFFKNNHNLTKININRCDFGDEGTRLFALAIGSCTIKKSLQQVELENNNIADEGMVDILTALSMHPNLEYLDLDGNCLRKNGCLALSTLLRCSAKVLQKLFISRNEINDEGIEALVPALKTCSHLKVLYLSDNTLITARGWQSLASILEGPNSNLERLNVSQNNIDDKAVATFANALTNNHRLEQLLFTLNPITDVGWQAFLKLLCDTSSVNATFLSNHTLQWVGNVRGDSDEIITSFLDLNASDDKKEVATIKILQSHDDFNMLPFFEWEFKCLPLVINWLERASGYEMPEELEPNFEGRKLSTIYQFVRGLPLLYVETRLRKELEDIKAAEKQMEEKLREFRQRKQCIMRKLGQKPESC